MIALQTSLFLVVAVLGTMVVLVRDPLHQAIVIGLFGLSLAALFTALEAPDVALSEIVVGGLVAPLVVLFALAKLRSLER